MFLRTALLAFAFATAAIPGATSDAWADETGYVTIQLTGLAPRGQVMLQVFNSEAGYGNGRALTARQVRITSDTATVAFEGVVPGQYAIRLFHDVNGNGELDTNPFGIPIEPFAFSNNARGRFGPAGWSDAVFTVNAGENVQTINVGGR
jgi:uncharacterized protein (DUF2141 family)